MTLPRLTTNEIADRLARVPEWAVRGDAIRRTFKFADFRAALRFVVSVGDAAEVAAHHPDMDIRYNKVTLALTTHDAGGLTDADFSLASIADGLAAEVSL